MRRRGRSARAPPGRFTSTTLPGRGVAPCPPVLRAHDLLTHWLFSPYPSEDGQGGHGGSSLSSLVSRVPRSGPHPGRGARFFSSRRTNRPHAYAPPVHSGKVWLEQLLAFPRVMWVSAARTKGSSPERILEPPTSTLRPIGQCARVRASSAAGERHQSCRQLRPNPGVWVGISRPADRGLDLKRTNGHFRLLLTLPVCG
jgi:hypothetical protein